MENLCVINTQYKLQDIFQYKNMNDDDKLDPKDEEKEVEFKSGVNLEDDLDDLDGEIPEDDVLKVKKDILAEDPLIEDDSLDALADEEMDEPDDSYDDVDEW